MKRVVVTGIGAITPLGNSFYKSWQAVKLGISGISYITKFDTSGIKWKIAGEVKGFNALKYLSLKEIHRLDLFAHYAIAAAMMAIEDAGLTRKASVTSQQSLVKINDQSKIIDNLSADFSFNSAGIIIGSSRGGISTLEREIKKARISAYLMPSTTISMASSYIAQKLGIKGYCLGISNACASGTNAIGEAYRLIKEGYHSLILCGGTEAPICRICVEGYGVAGALSNRNDQTASRPFDRTRDGFVISEGACILILEEYQHALSRNAKIYGEIIGYSNITDAHHQTIPSSEGEAIAIKLALDEANLKPKDIDFISSHGTSTPLGDRTETEAIKMVFGNTAYRIPITSFKSMTGHMLAASGALEAAFTLLTMKENIIPPTINLRERDEACDLDYVTEPRIADVRTSLSQSFGFGGVNAVLVLKRLNF